MARESYDVRNAKIRAKGWSSVSARDRAMRSTRAKLGLDKADPEWKLVADRLDAAMLDASTSIAEAKTAVTQTLHDVKPRRVAKAREKVERLASKQVHADGRLISTTQSGKGSGLLLKRLGRMGDDKVTLRVTLEDGRRIEAYDPGMTASFLLDLIILNGGADPALFLSAVEAVLEDRGRYDLTGGAVTGVQVSMG